MEPGRVSPTYHAERFGMPCLATVGPVESIGDLPVQSKSALPSTADILSDYQQS
jgi:hypothetical protein